MADYSVLNADDDFSDSHRVDKITLCQELDNDVYHVAGI